jgi:hypothetical protein
MAREKQTSPVVIKIPKGAEKQATNLKLYLVDKQGNVIESQSLKSGEVRLKTSAENVDGKTKVYIAPELPAELSQVTINENALKNMGAWQPSFRLPPTHVFQIPYFPPFPWPLPFGWCNVQGTVTKTFNVNGVPEVLPICDARVHICEVQRILFIIDRIPSTILNELRDRLASIIQIPIPIPGPDPGPIEQVNFSRAFQQTTNLVETRSAQLDLPELPELPQNVQNSILSGSAETFRATLASNFQLFHPFLCRWPWFWPWFYICDEIATVTTDCNGRFDYNIIYFLKNHPNVYVWVEVLIGGVWTTVYKPWISCYTHWNYACGTDINITITNPDVLPCFCGGSTVEDDHVWIKTVGSGTSVRSIQQVQTASGHLSNAVGLTAYGGYGNISPFASSFPFVVQFGDGLNAMGITYYRWSYMQKTDAYLTPVSDTKHILNGSLSKTYNHWIEVTPTDWENLPGTFTLGPFLDPSNNPMYKIPHLDASVDSGIAGTFWDADTASVYINTVGWNPGLYEFTIELLDNNGNVVPLADDPFKVDRLASDPPPLVPGLVTIDADSLLENGLPENYVIKNGSGQIIGFNFQMRVDNNYCYAGISDAVVAGGTTDTECGTGYYNDKNTDSADLYFQAGHPHNFGTYSFAVYKGNSGALSIAGSSGTTANANNALTVTSGDNGYDISQVDFPVPTPSNPVSNMDQYHKSILVKDMLGNCIMAAFSENVYVWATHTNGDTRIGYDASDVAAFSMAPHS